ncbi:MULTISPECIES: hypothetical protein [Mycobacterium]|uniref:Uncharacterized protein n=1 Tax=Mycobacterium colombiense TaxID=339268 RepID=A0A329MA36_9MYCO|nr:MULTISPECIES: hypothetical protein [Mycobacterium]MDM4138575.1 hypothetical protein [Mycobacterium sp. FLAC0960]RAV16006.1 hypothetical protein DQP57_03820 [Mycobacterium colombiense]
MSDALDRWQVERAEALDSLDSIHGKITGRKRGRKYNTKHLNRALFVALAAEFQGFCRDLHEDAAIHIANSLQTVPGNAKAVPVVLDALVRERTISSTRGPSKDRRLDKGNADFSALVTDFATLGILISDELKARYPRKSPKWVRTLEALNDARNGIAHSDAQKLASSDRDHGLTLATFRRWRSSLNGASVGMDRVVGAYLLDLTGTKPW